jgi:hypothetical protein
LEVFNQITFVRLSNFLLGTQLTFSIAIALRQNYLALELMKLRFQFC